MIVLVITSVTILIIAVFMAMTGRGGGNLYVPVLVASGISIYSAATGSQLLLITTALAAFLIFQKERYVDWKLALIIDPPTDIMAFFGGYYSHIFSGEVLKIVFAFFVFLAGILMLYPIRKSPSQYDNKKHLGFWYREYNGQKYAVNLWLAIPITAVTGFVSGMVGMSGATFKIPLMVLACGVPMKTAVGTSSLMVALTALMGFFGHFFQGDFNPLWAIPMAVLALIGGLIGGGMSTKINPDRLRKVFAYTTMFAGLFMAFNAFFSF